ncbi:hypothetical protein pdam_00008193 [Pocillopora damicornis]|uniref:Uncharacterized protein n=1 Tax=Pocillopora damicornis TaxID=46731 RepID=A0A3M6UTW7_POCDA|nr:hypothetical protein pdam_00008193 [Pocillopora damicornis]
MQHPFQGINTAIFFLVRRHRFADEMVVSTHILATEGLTQVITVHQIRWMSQPFMQTPGAEAPLTVKFIVPVGELCEEHIRITMEYGEIT